MGGFELSNPETPAGLLCRALNTMTGSQRLVFLAEMTGLQLRVEREYAHTDKGRLAPIWIPAPLATPPLRGFGGDGARCHRNRKDPKMSRRQNIE